ncbi:hypothetical protein SNEBB_004228 [Seison nebaliae]|nr:hypothetical protein SNEBB_004228 [Seison nebaliae]
MISFVSFFFLLFTITVNGDKYVRNDICSDKKECTSQETCCQLSDSSYACCPYQDATCCADKEHCCPNGYDCDVKYGFCRRNEFIIRFYSFKTNEKNEKNDIKCKDGSECPDGATCCQLASGEYGCCPLPSATCCSDHEHCCPNGYKCDVRHNTCNKGFVSIPWYKKHSSTPTSSKKYAKKVFDNLMRTSSVLCEDGISFCSVNEKCCKSDDSNHWMCCSKEYLEKNNDTVCPDKSRCPGTKNTCCLTEGGFYSCCPLENAICCANKLNCCPSDHKCGKHEGECIKMCKVNETICSYEHPKGNVTKCCPFQNGSCCEKEGFCCPPGYRCNNDKLDCELVGKRSVDELKKSVVCQHPTKQCGDHCCPYEDGICCGKMEFCCPKEFPYCQIDNRGKGKCGKKNEMNGRSNLEEKNEIGSKLMKYINLSRS